MLSRVIAGRLEQMSTPFYLYDMALLERTLAAVTDAAKARGFHIHYALKANNEPRIMEVVRRYGLGVDCVSGGEVRAAIESGFSPAGVVYAGVGKSDEEIIYCLEKGIFAFNCESRQEVGVINALAKERGLVANLALRINPDVDPHTHKYIATGKADSKFGISYKEISELSQELAQMRNVRVTGLHFHVGSQIRDMAVFEQLCRRVNALYEWFRAAGFDLSHVNLGGGLGIDYDDPEGEEMPDFERYFNVFVRGLQLAKGVEVHFELGRSVVAQCGELISRVLFTKTTVTGRRVAIVDTSMTDLIRPALYRAHHAVENLSGRGREKHSYILAGTVCESSDVFRDGVELPELRRGDIVTMKSAGAYGSVMSSTYNMHTPARAVFSDEL